MPALAPLQAALFDAFGYPIGVAVALKPVTTAERGVPTPTTWP